MTSSLKQKALPRCSPIPEAADCRGRQHKKELEMSNTTTSSTGNNRVGPVMRNGELASAVAEAAAIDNPGKEISVEDKRAYLRIETDDEMILRRTTIEECLGRPFELNELEVHLGSFAGRIETQDDFVRFYLTKHF